MIHVIADKLVTLLSGLTFKDKITGVVKTATVMVDSVPKKFPISYNTDPSTCSDSQLLDFCPDSKKTSILYFEDLGTEIVSRDVRGYKFTSNLQLVCWFNYKKLSGTMYEPSLIALNILKQIPETLDNFNDILGCTLEVIRQVPNDGSPFNKYTYAEERSQFITYPYDYVSFIIRAVYSIRPECIAEIIPDPQSC